jgi:hypothetical protein
MGRIVLQTLALTSWLSFPLISEPIPLVSNSTDAMVCLTARTCQLQVFGGSTLNVNQTIDVAGGSVNYQARASSRPGSLGVYEQDTVLKLPTPSNGWNGIADPYLANAEMVDQLTVSSPPFTGSLGFLELSITLNGSAGKVLNGQTVNGTGGMDVVATVDNPVIFPEQRQSQVFESLIGFNSPTDVTFPTFFKFIYGTPFSLTVDLNTFLFAGTLDATDFVNFFNTATITGLEVFDANMNPVPDAVFTSASGATYTQNGIVPEPSYLSLFGSVFLAIMLRFHTSRR